jgi:hypothetical protein
LTVPGPLDAIRAFGTARSGPDHYLHAGIVRMSAVPSRKHPLSFTTRQLADGYLLGVSASGDFEQLSQHEVHLLRSGRPQSCRWRDKRAYDRSSSSAQKFIVLLRQVTEAGDKSAALLTIVAMSTRSRCGLRHDLSKLVSDANYRAPQGLGRKIGRRSLERPAKGGLDHFVLQGLLLPRN